MAKSREEPAFPSHVVQILGSFFDFSKISPPTKTKKKKKKRFKIIPAQENIGQQSVSELVTVTNILNKCDGICYKHVTYSGIEKIQLLFWWYTILWQD